MSFRGSTALRPGRQMEVVVTTVGEQPVKPSVRRRSDALRDGGKERSGKELMNVRVNDNSEGQVSRQRSIRNVLSVAFANWWCQRASRVLTYKSSQVVWLSGSPLKIQAPKRTYNVDNR